MDYDKIEAGRGCGVCGGKLVTIRGRYPNTEHRHVCPTCLADRLDNIREIASPEYGQAMTAVDSLKVEGEG